ncbi:NADH ubiquinone oxidoreductase, 20 kDa subunit domain protein [Mycobacterium xenopi 4042]|uniref:NADH ubiquinone oxidoreductase, 20 kDa subunit domain protein n=1 Tax=Mycobacterium xenopi 4042 TaxID=1299334 RepID=X7Z5F9_MYCXE|nr:NADH ubiquinone oxidoreductase, 20 kDa subunit domain protein [Mycobacterium xenopi 4042]EUA33963.1 NADH ubiquinone oxidoreductase, 20 kDa subunit domain protein [Mycobacterium xenopi 3993]
MGSPGSAPRAISSTLGWVAAVNATESPSQLKPALIQRT